MEHLERFGIGEEFLKENVLFCDDQEIKDVSKVESVALVDFNELNQQFSELGNKVHFIVDHHVDNGLYTDTLKEKEIKLIGSACTLVIHKLLSAKP